MSGEQDPLLLLTPVLSSTNVHVVAKLAGKIPCSDSGATVLTSGMVFCAFALKLFWKGDTTHSTKSSTVRNCVMLFLTCVLERGLFLHTCTGGGLIFKRGRARARAGNEG